MNAPLHFAFASRIVVLQYLVSATSIWIYFSQLHHHHSWHRLTQIYLSWLSSSFSPVLCPSHTGHPAACSSTRIPWYECNPAAAGPNSRSKALPAVVWWWITEILSTCYGSQEIALKTITILTSTTTTCSIMLSFSLHTAHSSAPCTLLILTSCIFLT